MTLSGKRLNELGPRAPPIPRSPPAALA